MCSILIDLIQLVLQLLWVLLIATIAGAVVQSLASNLGVVTGQFPYVVLIKFSWVVVNALILVIHLDFSGITDSF